MMYKQNPLIAKVYILVFCLLMIVGCGQKTENTETIEVNQYSEIHVSLEGGTGKVTLKSPTVVEMSETGIVATIAFSSKNYDYMIVDGIKYTPVNEEYGISDCSVFQIPVKSLSEPLQVIADTVAMSTPHEIEYRITFLEDTLRQASQNFILYPEKTEDGNMESDDAQDIPAETREELPKSKQVNEMEFQLVDDILYATQFQIYEAKEGYRIFHIRDVGEFLWVPNDAEPLTNVPKEYVVINQPTNIYVASTSVMDLFRAMDSIDLVQFTGTESKDWCIDEISEAVEEKKILYAGKYSAPDMELLLSKNCDLAIENTMIYHKPEIKEQLEKLGIPVLVEKSSYESDPLGRMEWIKFFGYLTCNEDVANEVFEKEMDKLKPVLDLENTEKTVAFFYVSSNGTVNVRRPDDYVSKMIELAGGNYALKDMKTVDNKTSMSTINLQMEAFYEACKDTDILIYNSTIDGEIYTLDELYKKSTLFQDFKAVKAGNVYCTGKNMFQESMSVGTMILDLHQVLTNEKSTDNDFYFLHRVK